MAPPGPIAPPSPAAPVVLLAPPLPLVVSPPALVVDPEPVGAPSPPLFAEQDNESKKAPNSKRPVMVKFLSFRGMSEGLRVCVSTRRAKCRVPVTSRGPRSLVTQYESGKTSFHDVPNLLFGPARMRRYRLRKWLRKWDDEYRRGERR